MGFLQSYLLRSRSAAFPVIWLLLAAIPAKVAQGWNRSVESTGIIVTVRNMAPGSGSPMSSLEKISGPMVPPARGSHRARELDPTEVTPSQPCRIRRRLIAVPARKERLL